MSSLSENKIAPELKGYYEEYLDHREAYGLERSPKNTAITIQYGDENQSQLGLCYKKRVRSIEGRVIYKTPKILIDPKIKNPWTIRYVLYHELGHCIHKLTHDSEIKIMRAKYSTSGSSLQNRWPDYIADFFSN